MSRRLRTLSEELVRQAGRIMPAERRAWAEAMAAEIDHIDSDPAALGYALGALWTSAFQGLRSMNGLMSLARYGVVAATSLAAAAGAVLWLRAMPGYAAAGLTPPAILICGLLIAYLAAAAWALGRGGPERLIQAVWAALALNTLNAAGLSLASVLQPGAAHHAYFQALVIETYAALIALLAAGMALQSAPRWAWLRGWVIYR
jgi:hypothetical protein